MKKHEQPVLEKEVIEYLRLHLGPDLLTAALALFGNNTQWLVDRINDELGTSYHRSVVYDWRGHKTIPIKIQDLLRREIFRHITPHADDVADVFRQIKKSK